MTHPTSPATSPQLLRVAVIGGGPAGLMAAEVLASSMPGAGPAMSVQVFDAMPSVGRKFLLAGIGGLNLTHSEAPEPFMSRYGERSAQLQPLLASFGPTPLRAWAEALGVETFVGSSGRVFPKDMKAAPLLRAWLHRLRGAGVQFFMRHRWLGWNEAGALRFSTAAGEVLVQADAVVLALGGGSWARLGSDGAWVPLTMAAAIFLIFTVWHDGRERLGAQLKATSVGLLELPKLLAGTQQVSGTAIFLASRPDSVPSAFLRNLEHNRVVHESVVFLHIGFRRVPKVEADLRLTIDTLRPGIYSVHAHYGFMQDPDVMEIIQQCNRQGLRIFARDYTLFIGQHVVMPLEQRRTYRWQRQLFAWLQRRSVGAAEFFGMPLRRVVILSTVVEI